MVPELAASMAMAHPDVCVGIKTAHYWTHKPYDDDHPPWAAVDGAIAAAEICGLPVMYDFWHRPDRTYRDLLLEKARPGDIHTHMYAQQFPIVDSSGGPERFLFEAREKGIHFDLGHGAGSFWFRQAVPCIPAGHAPDSISTDLHTMNHAGPVHDQLTCMSKLMNMGLSAEQVIEKSTSAAARAIRRPELGTLSVGSCADVALLKVVDGPCAFVDCGKAKLTGDRQLECLMTIRAGEIVFNPLGMGLPEWPDAPPRYWEIRPVNAQQAANP
jgi:dihydroorotase